MTEVTAFVLVSVAPTKEREVYEALEKVPEIKDIHALYGEYDIICKVEAPNYNAVGEVVVDKIRKIHGVIDTRTMTAIRG